MGYLTGAVLQTVVTHAPVPALPVLCALRSMGYLKDAVLPRVLDDATFATLSSLMLFNNIEASAALFFGSPV